MASISLNILSTYRVHPHTFEKCKWHGSIVMLFDVVFFVISFFVLSYE